MVFQAAILIFLVGSLLAGLAQGMVQLILFRGIQGMGAGGLMTMTFAIVGDVVSPRQRGRYIGLLAGVWAFASVIGPLIGGFIVDNLSWRWVFLINLPVGVVALLVTSSVLHLPVERRRHRNRCRGGVPAGGWRQRPAARVGVGRNGVSVVLHRSSAGWPPVVRYC